jgi:hypothetical protein
VFANTAGLGAKQIGAVARETHLSEENAFSDPGKKSPVRPMGRNLRQNAAAEVRRRTRSGNDREVDGLNVTEIDASHPIQNLPTKRPKRIDVPRGLRAIRVDWNAAAEYFAGGNQQHLFYFLTPGTECSWVQERKLSLRTQDPATDSAASSPISRL